MTDSVLLQFLTIVAWLGLALGIFSLLCLWWAFIQFFKKYPNPTNVQHMLFAPSPNLRSLTIALVSIAWLVARYW